MLGSGSPRRATFIAISSIDRHALGSFNASISISLAPSRNRAQRSSLQSHEYRIMNRTLRAAALLMGCAATFVAPSRGQTTKTYTTTADFAEGLGLNTTATAVPDQLQLNALGQPGPLPLVQIAASGRGTLIRVDAVTGAILGEYATSPDGLGRNPSRTSVDSRGNVWVGNRGEASSVGRGAAGSVVKIGVVLGGTRVNSAGQPDATGEYLKGPFLYNTCVDRDGDGLIRTSRGLGDVLAWPDVTDGLGGATALVEDALDECIVVYQRTPAINIRHVSVDANDDAWVGGFPGDTQLFNKLDGLTGAVLSTFAPPCGGHGGVIDANNILWSSGGEGSTTILRHDIATGTSTCITTGANHGLGLGADGAIWVTRILQQQVLKLSSAGAILPGFPAATCSGTLNRSIAITPADLNAWVPASGASAVSRLQPDGTACATIPLGADGASPRGVAIDGLGKVWVACTNSDTLKRIDPATNSVDLTVPLGAGAVPYNYADMTGLSARLLQQQNGEWSVVYDSTIAANRYASISWTESTPRGTSLGVQFRAGDDGTALAALAFADATNGASLSGVQGRFVEVRVRFTRPTNSPVTPVLFDLTIQGAGDPPRPAECSTPERTPGSLLVFPFYDNLPGRTTLATVTNTSPTTPIAVEYVYIARESIDGAPLSCLEFNRTHLLTPNDTLTVATRAHAPDYGSGYLYCFAKSPAGGAAIAHDHLVGDLLAIDGMAAASFGVGPWSFRAVPADGQPTDLDGDWLRDLDGREYVCAPDELLVPRFLGQIDVGGKPLSYSERAGELVLLNLSGGTAFDALVDILLHNDNEEVFSAQTTFRCWTRRKLVDISPAFAQSFLETTNNAPGEILGAPHVESGWFRLDGRIAWSTAASIADPAILAAYIERTGPSNAACDLPFLEGSQQNGDLLALGPLGDTTP
jgi:streptogramin lyase